MDPLILIISLLLPSIFFYTIITSSNHAGKTPPGPRGVPILGYLPFMGTNMLQKLTHLSHQYGPIFKLRLGTKLAVVISSPALVKEVVRDHDHVFSHRDATEAALAYSRGARDIVFSPPDASWRAMRKVLVRETQSSAALDSSRQLRREEIRRAVRSVYSQTGRPLAFGKLMDALDQILEKFITQHNKKLSSNEEGRKDFLQIASELKENKDSDMPTLSRDQLKSLLTEIISGGSDTSATTVEFAMSELLNSPEAMGKVQKELYEVVGMNNIVEESHLPKLHFLNVVIKETLRLHPPVPFLIPRAPLETSIVGGYTIPKGTKILLNVWAIHRDPSIWVKPEEFRPERFLEDSRNMDFKGNNFEFIPFGSGRRMCPGLPLAERMVAYLLASFLHSFDWKLPDAKKLDMSESLGLVLEKTNPSIAIPTPRLSHASLYM